MRTLFTEKQRVAERLRKAKADHYLHPTKDNAERVKEWQKRVAKMNQQRTILQRMGYE